MAERAVQQVPITTPGILKGFYSLSPALAQRAYAGCVTAARDVLLGLNKGNEQALGVWGFTVDTSPPVKKPEKNTPPPTS